MLAIPADSSNIVGIVSIDPGSTTTGISIINVNLDTRQIHSSQAWTINTSKLVIKDAWLENFYGNRYLRIIELEKYLIQLFNNYRPIIICAEAPFINQRFPAAGIALTEVMCSIRRAVTEYDVWCELKIIPPSSVKNGINAKGNADKDEMKRCINLLYPDLHFIGDIPFELLDEHSVDAIAVGYTVYRSIIS